MKHRHLTAITLLAVLCLPLTSLATNNPPQRYQFELIVFRYLDTSQWNSERWPADVPFFMPKDTLSLSDQPDALNPIATPTTAFTLNKEAQKLAATSNIEVLTHLAWTQSRETLSEPHPIAVFGGEHNDDAPNTWTLQGTMTPTLHHYFQVQADLLLTLHPDEARTALSDADFIGHSFPTETVRFEMNQTRKMKSAELNYFDHPVMGMLMLITPQALPLNDQTPSSPVAIAKMPGAFRK